MYSSIIMIILNILSLYWLSKKDKKKNINEYIIEKEKFYKKKVKLLISIINISYILINIIYFILLIVSNGFKTLQFSLFIVNTIIYTILLISSKIETFNEEIINKRIISNYDIMIISSIILITSIEKVADFYTLDIIMIVISSISVLINILIIVFFYIKNRNIVVYNIKEEHYLEDIRFNNKIQINKIFNAIIYIVAYIVFAYIRIPFQYIIYILIGILLIYVIINKIKKITYQSNKLYKSIYVAKKYPGLVYAFQFTKDLLLLKKLLILIIIFTLSITALYGLGEVYFGVISFELYLLFAYTYLEDKKYLINYIRSLNEDYINKNVYKIKQNKKVSYIDTIEIFNLKLYKLIFNDNTIIYESNLILYDPELITDNLNIYINKSNIDDYITIESILYEEE